MTKLKKFFAVVLSAALLFVQGFYATVDTSAMISAGVPFVTALLPAIVNAGVEFYKMKDKFVLRFQNKIDKDKLLKKIDEFNKVYGGFKKDVYAAINEFEEEVCDGVVKFYGQKEAREKCAAALRYYFYRLYDFSDHPEKCELIRNKFRPEPRNVFYILGKPGTGKTTLAMALANAVLKEATQTLFIVDTHCIITGVPLGDQLFKIQPKITLVQDVKNKKYWGVSMQDHESELSVTEFNDTSIEDVGGISAQTVSNLLAHLICWRFQAVIVIENYNLMKKIADPKGQDKTADEILKSIASTGSYSIGLQVIDCSRSLFIVTSQETIDELKKNFGQNGEEGGGLQRLNIIQLKDDDEDSYRRIVNEIVEEVRNMLQSERFSHSRIKSVSFTDNTYEEMKDFISKSDIDKGRAKYKLLQALTTAALCDQYNISDKTNVVITSSVLDYMDSKMAKESVLYFRMPRVNEDYEGDTNLGAGVPERKEKAIEAPEQQIADKKVIDDFICKIANSDRSELDQLHHNIDSSNLGQGIKDKFSKMCDARLGDIEKLEKQMQEEKERKSLVGMIGYDKGRSLADIPVIDEKPLRMSGIVNFDNSCYFNAMIQQLYRYPLFKKFLLNLYNDKSISELKKKDEEAFVVYYNLMKVFAAMDKGEAVNENSINIIRYICFKDDEFFKGQKDANEFCLYIFGKLGFNAGFEEYSTLENSVDREKNGEKKPVTVLQIQIDKKTKDEGYSTQSCLDMYLAEEILSDYKASNGKETPTKKQIHFCQLASNSAEQSSLVGTMVISLKRFSAKGEKIFTPVELSDKIEVPIDSETYTYQLKGIVMHTGETPKNGHYVSYIRDGGKWFLLDDSEVSPISTIDTEELKRNAYILRYERIKQPSGN